MDPVLFFLYVNDLPQAVKCVLYLNTDDASFTFQHENVKENQNELNLSFSSLRDWFIDNELSIHLGEDKAKSILFVTKFKLNELNH